MSQEISSIIEDMGNVTEINGGEGSDEQRRIEILADINELTHYAVQGNFVLVRTNRGRCLIEKRDKLVGFMFKAHNQIGCVSFWYNASSVTHLGDLLRANAKKRVSMQQLTQR
jgi:hypothetical protein